MAQALPIAPVRRHGPAALGLGALLFALAWVAYKAFGNGFGETSDAPVFVVVALNGISLAAVYFIVASGFTLIFGLMRVVNMAHGSFYLLGGYVASTLLNHEFANWWVDAIVASLAVGAFGLVMQQLLLRWNQGQELRQALITIAVSIILADQMVAHFGGVARVIEPPGRLAESVSLHLYDLQYPAFRLFVIGVAVLVAAALWLAIQHTR